MASTKNILKYPLFLFITLSFFLYSCEKVKPEEIVIEEKDKTILLYFSADNNLYFDAAQNINTIVNGYIPDNKNNLLIYSINLDLEKRQIKDEKPVLVHVYKDANNSVIKDTVYRFPYQNSSTKQALNNTLNIVKTLFPAKVYGLVLWSHGTGWIPEGYTESSNFVANRARNYTQDPYAHLVKSFGSERDMEISIFDLKDALPMNFDFIAFDACYMGCIEVAYELKDKCNYLIFSPAEVLTYSYDYTKVIEGMFNAEYEKVSYDIYQYYNNMQGNLQSVTISTVKTEGLEDVALIAKNIYDNHRAKIPNLDMDNIQPYFRYNAHWFYDLNNFIENIATPQEAAEFKSALEKVVVAKYTTGRVLDLEIDINKFSGISSYINNPSNEQLDTYYKRYEWEKMVGMIP